MYSRVTVDVEKYPACVRKSISEFDPDRVDRYTEFGESTHGPTPIGDLPYNTSGFYIYLTKQNILKLEVSRRMVPTEEEEKIAEVFLAKVTGVLAQACN